MGGRQQQGFTIIEVMLFLSLTALLAVLLLSGWTLTINNQRYRDSVRTTQSFLQQQYGLVYNVENDRSDQLICDSSTNEVAPSPSVITGNARGTSDCVLLGRYINIKNGTVISSNAIVGREPNSTVPTGNDDYADIANFEPTRVDPDIGLSDATLNIPWGATIVSGAAPTNYAIAIVRAPNTGIVHTFTQTVPAGAILLPDIRSFATAANEASDTDLCIQPGTPFTGGAMGVRILKGASAQSFVRTITKEDTGSPCN